MEKKQKKKKWKIIVPVVIVLGVVFFIAGKNRDTAAGAVQTVETAKVKKGNITAELETSGTIGSEEVRTYSSPVTAEVETVNVQVGKTVKKGEYLLDYNTASLEKSYTISELQSRAENAANQKALEMSDKGSTQAAEADSRVQALDGQISSLNGQITDLSNQLKTSREHAEKVAELEEKLNILNERITELGKKEELSQNEREELEKLQKEKEKKEGECKAYGDTANQISELENRLAGVQSQMEGLQGSRAEAQAKKEAGEASVLTEAEKQGIRSSQQAAGLTLSQSADALSTARAGVTAEFDGIITSAEITAGSVAQEGTPMFSIADVSKMCVDFKVSKYNLKSLKEGQKVSITSLDKKYGGSIVSIGKVAEKTEEGATMASARVHIDNPDADLIIGLDANLKIQLGEKKDVLKVPIAAVNTDSKGDFIYVLEKNKVKQKYVKTGIASDKEIEISKGLKEGEKVITTIDSAITDGAEAVEAKSESSKE